MDVHKVSPLANSTASSKTQTPGNILEGVSMLASSFVNMIRVPMANHQELFSNSDQNFMAKNQAVESKKQHQAPERKDTEYKSTREESNDHSSYDQKENDYIDDSKNTDNYSSQNRDASNSYDHDDNNDETVTHDDKQNKSSGNEQDSGRENTKETVEASSGKNDKSTENDVIQTALNENSNNVASNAGSNTEGFNAALDGLIGAAQSSSVDVTAKDAAQALKNIVVDPSKSSVQATGNNLENSNQQATGGNTQEEFLKSDQAQKVLRAITRLGVGTSQQDVAQAAKIAEVSLTDQQARMLSDKLKLDRPVNIHVNVNNRANAAVSQTSQSLNSNAVTVQAMENGNVSNGDARSVIAQSGNSQLSVTAGEAHNLTHVQSQATNQLTNTAANVSADRGIARAITQVMSNVDSANASAQPSNTTTQQGSNIAKPLHVQTPNTPEQSRPLSQQISVNITKAIASGLDKITVQLRPDNLGRVEIQLEVAKNGKVSATIIADRPETLEMLRADSRNLERALQDAGLDTKSDDLKFSLRDQQNDSNESQADSEMAEDSDDSDDLEIEMQDGTPEAELAASLLNGDLDKLISSTHIDIEA